MPEKINDLRHEILVEVALDHTAENQVKICVEASNQSKYCTVHQPELDERNKFEYEVGVRTWTASPGTLSPVVQNA